MMNKGWISVHRNLFDHWLWKEEEPFDKRSAWIDLLLMVNYEDKKMLFDGELITVKRGQKITSILALSKRWKWSRTKTKRFLELLQEDEMILLEISTRKKTTITVVNYGLYQDESTRKKTSERQQKYNRSTTEVQQKDINNNINNINNDDDDVTVQNYLQELSNLTQNKASSSQIKKLFKKYGADNMNLLLEKIKESKYLQKNINFNRIGNRFLDSVLQDKYKDYESVSKDKSTAFHNFKQITDDYSEEELEEVAMRKQREAFKKLGVET